VICALVVRIEKGKCKSRMQYCNLYVLNFTESQKISRLTQEATAGPSRKKSKLSRKYVRQKNTQDYKCQKCTACFSTQLKLQAHGKEMSHYIDINCSKCNTEKEFPSFQSLRRHMRDVHCESLEDLSTRTCSVCSKVFPSSGKLKTHTKTVHPETKEFQCVICQKEFSAKRYLQEHLLRTHVQDRVRFPCTKCSESFASRPGLSRHLKYKHTEEDQKNYIFCEVCDKKFLRRENYKLHIVIHDSKRQKTLTCPRCDKAFYTVNMLRSHMKTHEFQKEALCTFCGAVFLTAGALRRHIKVKHVSEDLEGGPQYTCHICGKSFLRKDYLAQHLKAKSHGGDGF